MASFDNVQRWLLVAASALAAVLLVRFAIDFSAGMPALLAAPFWALVLAALAVSFANATTRPGAISGPPVTLKRVLLHAAIPLGFIASSLDCTGLSVEGCSPFCTFVKIAWVPLIAISTAAYFFTKRKSVLTAVVVMLLVPIAPHCVCYNVANGWWIERLGASPVCYAWGLAVGAISTGAIRSGARAWLSIAVCFAIIGGATAFFVSHHYFHFPW